MERMKELIHLLNNAARLYYSGDSTVMSDYDYDRLYDELLSLENTTGMVLSGSPTQRVGYEAVSRLSKLRHEYPMLSLDKTKDPEALSAFLAAAENGIEQPSGLLSWKLDGLTVSLLYTNGALVQAATRGNGTIGEDITHNARVFKNVPLKINHTGELRLRGEAVIAFADFEKINSGLPIESQYKNPRNLCSGTVRQLNSKVTAARNVMFLAFGVINHRGLRKSESLDWLKTLGFDVVEHRLVNSSTIAATVEQMRLEAGKNAFATDGLVLTYDSIAYSESLGSTSKFPKDSIAFKWADELSETRLKEVQWNTSRTGLINPVAIFEPVELEGTTVNKASLHNVSIFESLELGSGDLITVYKANMIIPQVAENLTKSNTENVPEHCNVCGFDAEIIQANEGRALYCTNPNCRARLVSGLEHFTSRDAMNIEGLSEATIEKFVERGFLNNYTDIYDLKKYANEIKTMEGFGEKSVTKLLDAIERSKTVAMPNFIYALGINQVGLSNAKLLCRHFNCDLIAIRSASEDDFLEIAGFGGIIAHSLHKYFHNPELSALLDKILSILNFEAQDEPQSQPLAGLTFVITGSLVQFNNRKELQALIESSGGKVISAVSAKTSYLINNSPQSSSAKNKKASELGVPVITEDEFRQKFM